jgi:hypothetical protein
MQAMTVMDVITVPERKAVRVVITILEVGQCRRECRTRRQWRGAEAHCSAAHRHPAAHAARAAPADASAPAALIGESR